MTKPSDLLSANRTWSEDVTRREPGLFERLSAGQSPSFLWIGCADSRVPPEVITGSAPGELFVHRNVANVVNPGDDNAVSVLEFALGALEVEHVVVCGHYGCGGVAAALGEELDGPLERWVGNVRRVARAHGEELESLDPEARWRRLCELNVAAQVAHVRDSDPVRAAWREDRPLAVHGWIYSLREGRLLDLDLTVDAVPEGER